MEGDWTWTEEIGGGRSKSEHTTKVADHRHHILFYLFRV